ncbi:hypothetical protein FRC03_008709 [Tulasnella sp. 419]|nr:hypothetical protein FRC02_000195 [Tulasnella sp. 418]KAG8958905.1 hypothetical protein FRC03_008709 [Tulasnella sp. 419]
MAASPMPVVTAEAYFSSPLVRGTLSPKTLEPMMGMIKITNAKSITWNDGAVLTLSSLSVKLSSYAVPGGQASEAMLYQTYGSADLINRAPQKPQDDIQFGSSLIGGDGSHTVSFAARVPPQSLLVNGTTSFRIVAQATYVRFGKPTSTSPVQYEINSSPTSVSLTHRN